MNPKWRDFRMFRVITVFFLFLGGLSLHAVESLDQLPYAGLILDKVEIDGITIRNFQFGNGKKYTHVFPEKKVICKMDYEIDADELKTLRRHHLVIGLYGDGPQECVTSSLGFADSSGTSTVKLKAPKTPGIYEVRVSVGQGLTCEGAKKSWHEKAGPNSVLGFVVVESGKSSK